MKKYLLWIVLTIFLASLVSAAVDNSLFDAKSIQVDFSLTNSFSVIPTKQPYSIDSLSANLFWFPIDDYRQNSESIITTPKSDFINNKSYSYSWIRPKTLSFNMQESSKITLEKKIFEVDKKISFPLKNIPQEYAIYLKPREITDSNEKIKNLASEIVSGETDAMIAVFDLAVWVENNIQYDLNSITADASQKSSWVLQNEQGVCDELTSLFISMARSVGIPARFVSGVSYSNVNQQNDGWGPHGWAEVYIPGYGWMPVDVTYKQIGYIDATHIKLSVEHDAKSSSVEYSSFGRNIQIKSGALDFDINVLKKTEFSKPLLNFDMVVDKEEVGFGSYNLAILTIENDNDFYVSENIRFSNLTTLMIEQNLNIPVIIGPKEIKNYYWLIKTPANLDKNYIYTFPLTAKGEFEEQADISFKMKRDSEVFSQDYMKSKIPVFEESRPLSEFVDVKCTALPSELYQNEISKINCEIENNVNIQLKNAKICLERNCTIKTLEPHSRIILDYNHLASNIGSTTLTFSVDSKEAFRADYITLLLKDEPSVLIENVIAPINISFEDSSNIRILLEKKSSSSPVNAKLRLTHKTLDQTWDVEMEKEKNELVYSLRGSDLQQGKNDFNAILTYQDEKGKQYSDSEDFVIILNEPTFSQKILLWMHIVDFKINKFIASI